MTSFPVPPARMTAELDPGREPTMQFAVASALHRVKMASVKEVDLCSATCKLVAMAWIPVL